MQPVRAGHPQDPEGYHMLPRTLLRASPQEVSLTKMEAVAVSPPRHEDFVDENDAYAAKDV